MKTFLLNISLYVSSFIPLYFLIIVKELIEIINGNIRFNVTNSVMLGLNTFLILIGITGIGLIFRRQTFATAEVITYKNVTCENFFPYFPLFVLFALAFELEHISMAVVYALILIMIGIVYIKNDLFYINPFLNIIGFNSYVVTYKQGDKIIENVKMFHFGRVKDNILLGNKYILKKKNYK